MTLKGSFAIEGSFKIANRGIVIYGSLIDGAVKKDNWLYFIDNGQEVKLRITEINFIDKISEGIAKVALTFYYENEDYKIYLDSLQPSAQLAKIFLDR